MQQDIPFSKIIETDLKLNKPFSSAYIHVEYTTSTNKFIHSQKYSKDNAKELCKDVDEIAKQFKINKINLQVRRFNEYSGPALSDEDYTYNSFSD